MIQWLEPEQLYSPFMSSVLMYSFMWLSKQALCLKTNYWLQNQRIKVIVCYFHLQIPSLSSAVIYVCEQWSTSKRKTVKHKNFGIYPRCWNLQSHCLNLTSQIQKKERNSAQLAIWGNVKGMFSTLCPQSLFMRIRECVKMKNAKFLIFGNSSSFLSVQRVIFIFWCTNTTTF